MTTTHTDPEKHNCLEHLSLKRYEWVETHGLDCGPYEHCAEEWWHCDVCGEEFTEADCKQMQMEAINEPK